MSTTALMSQLAGLASLKNKPFNPPVTTNISVPDEAVVCTAASPSLCQCCEGYGGWVVDESVPGDIINYWQPCHCAEGL